MWEVHDSSDKRGRRISRMVSGLKSWKGLDSDRCSLISECDYLFGPHFCVRPGVGGGNAMRILLSRDLV